MSPTNTPRELFMAAVNLPAAERPAFLDRVCGADANLRERVEALLRADEASGAFLSEVGGPPEPTRAQGAGELRGTEAAIDADDGWATEAPGPDELPGAVLGGRYKLLEEIGEGGMGRVYMAQQTEPVRRTVAVKVIKAGMDTKAVLARFEAERQALAMMDHPNIARVLDAGTTDGGRPFFVMELVKGQPITRYCDDRRLSLRQRLELFLPVCQAIQHAHQKGIIHRDIKPSNVLVALYDDRAVPKVIDFGVAKAAGSQLTERTLVTGFGAVVGTPEYMSPEQANLNNLDIDTRSDVYSLGVLLYELLTGSTPVDRRSLGQAALLEILRIVRDVEAPPPSARLSTLDTRAKVAANRGSEPGKLSNLMRGELDWVLLKALDKDRTRRYETANGFARDIQRYLADEVVEARPPSTGYRIRKFVRRHRGQVLSAGLVLLALLVGVAGTTFGLIEARRQRDVAEQARQKEAEAATLANQERERATEAERVAREEAAAATAVRKFLQDDLLGMADLTQQAEASRATGADIAVKRNPTVGELLDRAAANLTPQKIESRFPGMPFVQAEALKAVGGTYSRINLDAKGLPLLARSVDLFTRSRGADDPATLSARHDHGVAEAFAGNPAKGIELLEGVLADRRRVLGPHHPDTFDTRTVFAMARLRHGRLLDAVNELGRIRDEAIIHLGPAHLQAIIPTGLYVNLLTKAGRGREAITVIEEMTKASWAGDVRSDHPYVHVGRAMLIDAYLQAGRTSEAKMLAEAARTRPGAEAMRSTLIAAGFGRLGAGRGNDAVLLFEWGIAGEASESETRLEGLSGLAHAYRALGRNQDEVPIREQILAGWRQRKPEDDPLVLDAIREFGAALIGAGRREEGTELLEELIPRLRKTLGPEHPQTLSALQTLSNSSSGQRAVELAGEVVAAHRKGLLKTRELSNALANLGTGLLKTGKPAEGEAALREAMEIQLAIDREGWVAALRRASHGWALLELKRYPEAEAQLLAGYREMSERVSIMPAYHANHPQYTAKRLVRLYEETGKPKEADAWRAKVEQHRRERKKPDPAPTPPKKQDDAEPKSPPTATKPPADRAPTKPADSASHAPIHKPQPGAKPMDKPADQPVPAGGAAKPS